MSRARTSDSIQHSAWEQLVGELYGPHTAYAMELARAYTTTYPEHMGGWYALAQSLCRAARFSEARAALLEGFTRPKQGRPGFAFAQCGEFRASTGDYVRAARWYRRAARLAGNRRYLSELAKNLFRQGLLEESEAWYRLALRESEEPMDEPCYGLALVLRSRGEYGKALDFLDKALELDPKSEDMIRARSDVLLAMARSQDSGSPATGPKGDLREASWEELVDARFGDRPAFTLQLAREFVARHPGGPGCAMLSDASSDLARYDEARRALLSCLGPSQGHWLFSMSCAHYHSARGDHVRASRWLRRAAKTSGRTECLIFLGESLTYQGRLDDAEECFRASIKRSDDLLDEAYYNLGVVLRCRRRYSEAGEAFDAALQVTPDYPIALEGLEDIELAVGLMGGP